MTGCEGAGRVGQPRAPVLGVVLCVVAGGAGRASSDAGLPLTPRVPVLASLCVGLRVPPQGRPRPGTILHTERAGVLNAVLGIRAGSLGLPRVGEGSPCALHHAAEGREVVRLVLIEVPAEAWGPGPHQWVLSPGTRHCHEAACRGLVPLHPLPGGARAREVRLSPGWVLASPQSPSTPAWKLSLVPCGHEPHHTSGRGGQGPA